MAYEPLNLQNGQTLTAEDLQHMEDGILANEIGALVVTVVNNFGELTADKTMKEIEDAMAVGRPVVCLYYYEEEGERFLDNYYDQPVFAYDDQTDENYIVIRGTRQNGDAWHYSGVKITESKVEAVNDEFFAFGSNRIYFQGGFFMRNIFGTKLYRIEIDDSGNLQTSFVKNLTESGPQ